MADPLYSYGNDNTGGAGPAGGFGLRQGQAIVRDTGIHMSGGAGLGGNYGDITTNVVGDVSNQYMSDNAFTNDYGVSDQVSSDPYTPDAFGGFDQGVSEPFGVDTYGGLDQGVSEPFSGDAYGGFDQGVNNDVFGGFDQGVSEPFPVSTQDVSDLPYAATVSPAEMDNMFSQPAYNEAANFATTSVVSEPFPAVSAPVSCFYFIFCVMVASTT